MIKFKIFIIPRIMAKSMIETVKSMSNLSIDKRCSVCLKYKASYGLEDELTHCKECAPYNMINKCVECNKTAFFIKDGKISYCFDCKKDDMISHKFYKCVLCETSQSVYGYVETYTLCCSSCALSNMKNVKNKKCEECGVREATWGITNKTHCSDCKKDNMVRLKKKNNPKKEKAKEEDKPAFRFMCEKCEYYTNRSYDYDRHCKSKRHIDAE